MRTQFDEKLRSYYNSTICLGTMVEEYLSKCIAAFRSGDKKAAESLIPEDKRIDRMQLDLEQESVGLLLLQAPVAGDFRKIITSIKIFANLERIGDYACHLAKLTVKSDRGLFPEFVEPISRMAMSGAGMIRDSITAYIEDNERLAMDTAAKDSALDAAKKQIVSRLIRLSPGGEAEMRQVYRYISICKDLERLGDHVTTICEWVVFTVSGKILDLGRLRPAE